MIVLFWFISQPSPKSTSQLLIALGLLLAVVLLSYIVNFFVTPLLRMKPDNYGVGQTASTVGASKSFFAPQACPYCGQPTFSFWKKVHLNALFGRDCTSCHGAVSVPWYSNFLIGVVPALPLFWLITNPHFTIRELIITCGITLVLTAVAWTIDFRFVPLIKKNRLIDD
jgi:hypothetical protein